MRPSRLFFQSTILRAARDACGHAFGRAMVEFRDLLAQFPQALRLILVLAPLLSRSDDDAGWQVLETDGALRRVDVLTSGAARSEGVDFAFAQQVLI